MTLTDTLALTCLALLAVGFAIVGLLAVLPATRKTALGIWPVLLTETLIVGAAVAAIWLDGWVLLAALLILSARIGFEVTRVALDWTTARAWGAGIALAALAWVLSFLPLGPLAIGLSLLWLGVLIFALTGARTVWVRLLLFPILPLCLFVAAALNGQGALLLAAFLLVETFDSYALLGGKLFGRRPAFPTLSPRKTIEGLATGALMLVLTAALLGPWVFGVPLLPSIGAALLAGGLSVAGDLAASRIKRVAGVKDYPQILPHQGGLFDITDAWIATGAGLALAVVVF